MKEVPEKAGAGRGTVKASRTSPGILLAVMAAVVIVGGAIAYKTFQSAPPPQPPPADNGPGYSQPAAHSNVRPIMPRDDIPSAPAATPAPAPTPVASPAPPAAPAFEPVVDAHQLVSSLAALDGKQPITAEQAQKWKENLQRLIRQGPSSVPGIQEYLAQNQDVNYAGVSGAGALGFNSLRSAMLDALGQIGGAEATAAMLQTMQSSIFPSDIATLAKSLEAQAPGQYQQDILNAVRQQLSLAALDQLGGANVGPLFQVLANAAASGAPITGDLAQYAEKWPYYSAIALATLPNNAGVPALIQMAQGALGSNQAAAAQALAEMSLQNSDALNSLLNLAKNGQLSDPVLAQLGPFLAGRQYQLGPPADPMAGGYQTYHMAGGNQDFSSYDTLNILTPAQINQRLALIDQFIQAVPSTDSAAQEALQQQKSLLTSKLAK
ncbi:MAG: hypothetical protein ABSH38_10465 [Verrucomicrobiota bacterium]|jgi:hypothetical protein